MTKTQPSLAARVHALIGEYSGYKGIMSPQDQIRAFGVRLTDCSAAFDVHPNRDGTFSVSAWDDCKLVVPNLTLTDIQAMIERAADQDFDDFESDGLTPDYYRTFPRDESAAVIIRNDRLGRIETAVDTDLDAARENFALRHGYADWAEMRALAPAGDEEDWVVEWKDGDPETCRQRAITALEAEATELSAKLRDLAAVEENKASFERWEDVQLLLKMYRGPNEDAA